MKSAGCYILSALHSYPTLHWRGCSRTRFCRGNVRYASNVPASMCSICQSRYTRIRIAPSILHTWEAKVDNLSTLQDSDCERIEFLLRASGETPKWGACYNRDSPTGRYAPAKRKHGPRAFELSGFFNGTNVAYRILYLVSQYCPRIRTCRNLSACVRCILPSWANHSPHGQQRALANKHHGRKKVYTLAVEMLFGLHVGHATSTDDSSSVPQPVPYSFFRSYHSYHHLPRQNWCRR